MPLSILFNNCLRSFSCLAAPTGHRLVYTQLIDNTENTDCMGKLCITVKIYKKVGLPVTSRICRAWIIVCFEKMWKNMVDYKDTKLDLSPAAENKFHN